MVESTGSGSGSGSGTPGKGGPGNGNGGSGNEGGLPTNTADFVNGVRPGEYAAFMVFFNVITNNGAYVEQCVNHPFGLQIGRPSLDMDPRVFMVSFWGRQGQLPDPTPNIMITELRQPGPNPTIWIGFSSTGVHLGGSPAPAGFREYMQTRLAEFMQNYIAFGLAERVAPGSHNPNK